MLGALAHFKPEDAVAQKDMPELERLMLHRLAEINPIIRKAYAEFDYKRVVATLSHFMNVELSSFYFDIRKDTLYCEAPSSVKRKAALSVIDTICDAVIKWLAPILVYTADEAWTQYHPGEEECVHLQQMPDINPAFLDKNLAERWALIRSVRSAVTGALELERAAKRIGSSLEAAPIVYVDMDASSLDILKTADLADICITSDITIRSGAGPVHAFRLDELKSVAVVSAKASGQKCARSWRYTSDVGSDKMFPDVSARDALALHELKALGKI
jgi:isoleucyl-tRNA synthetase